LKKKKKDTKQEREESFESHCAIDPSSANIAAAQPSVLLSALDLSEKFNEEEVQVQVNESLLPAPLITASTTASFTTHIPVLDPTPAGAPLTVTAVPPEKMSTTVSNITTKSDEETKCKPKAKLFSFFSSIFLNNRDKMTLIALTSIAVSVIFLLVFTFNNSLFHKLSDDEYRIIQQITEVVQNAHVNEKSRMATDLINPHKFLKDVGTGDVSVSSLLSTASASVRYVDTGLIHGTHHPRVMNSKATDMSYISDNIEATPLHAVALIVNLIITAPNRISDVIFGAIVKFCNRMKGVWSNKVGHGREAEMGMKKGKNNPTRNKGRKLWF